MDKKIGPSLRATKTLLHVKKQLLKLFKITKEEQSGTKIGYLAGIINSDGKDNIEINRKKLSQYAERLRKLHKFPMFSAIDVFPPEIYRNLQEWELPFEQREEKVRMFWREILKSGHVTDVFMTPGWKKSRGATDEHKTAGKIGLKIHYVEETH